MVCKFATKKKNGNVYYYYKHHHCKTYYNEYEVEENLLDLLIKLKKEQELLDNYYTPFIKSKLEDNTEIFTKKLK